ncbi:MAG: ABC transporter ATP-binding protein, partial [Myxococcota bacterium]
PSLLVVDEPMVGLDPKGARLIKSIFRKICSDAGLTVFLSTHSLEVAEELCERIAIIQHGDIVTLSTLDQLRAELGREGSRLEEIFLQLTSDEDDVSREQMMVDEVIANQAK